VTEQKIRAIEVTALEAYLECDLLNKSVQVHRHTVASICAIPARVKYHQESIVERIQIPRWSHSRSSWSTLRVRDRGQAPLVSVESGLRRCGWHDIRMRHANLVDLIRKPVLSSTAWKQPFQRLSIGRLMDLTLYPMLRRRANIAKVERERCRVRDLAATRGRVIFVDDGSRDGTWTPCSALSGDGEGTSRALERHARIVA